MKTASLTPELRHQMDACWRAANYLSVGQTYAPEGADDGGEDGARDSMLGRS